jgi:choline-sulfatase
MYGEPGTGLFKVMVREENWKYIFMANGNREQLFALDRDPHETVNLAETEPGVRDHLRRRVVEACYVEGAMEGLDNGDLRTFPFRRRPPGRIYQFDRSRGVTGFPETPEAGLAAFRARNSSVNAGA